MIIQCPDCTTRYELDDRRVPAGRVRVRCARCAYVFPIEAEAPAPEAPAVEAPVAEAPAAQDPGITQDAWASGSQHQAQDVPVEHMETVGTPGDHLAGEAEPMTGMESTRIEDPAVPEMEMDPGLDLEIERPSITQKNADPAEEAVPDTATATMTEEPAAAEETVSPTDKKAKRLARALVSDILVYNRDKRDKALAEGTLVQALGQEIKKSWELYKERVTPEVASNSNYFKDALNDILAEGQKIF